MTARVVDLTAFRRARREAGARALRGLSEDSTFLPVGVIVQRLLDDIRLRRLQDRREEGRS